MVVSPRGFKLQNMPCSQVVTSPALCRPRGEGTVKKRVTNVVPPAVNNISKVLNAQGRVAQHIFHCGRRSGSPILAEDVKTFEAIEDVKTFGRH